MDITLGPFPCRTEKPEPQKFAWPILLLPELFTTAAHQTVLLGYLATIGWEVFAPDLRAAAPALGTLGFDALASLAAQALEALGQPAVVIGHGIGGLIALKLAETQPLKAVVAMAPLVPGFANPLTSGWSGFLSRILKRAIKPPAGRTLFEFLFDVDSFQRPAMVQALVPDAVLAAQEVSSGRVSFARLQAPPRLVIAGEVDTIAPLERVIAFADSIGAATTTARSRGHWLIGGRAMERTVGEAHRFLVRALGQDLLLLFPEEWKSEDDESGR